ncbi:unnamed protein product [Polarella glacialis]|uniref:Nickel/cobalt efflux system n=1 Tax=Polarella glacialis TaxID=89957 RepID=A0A813KLF4_POLGL|nr:unnamed protein product [Polarella glacialis]
MYLGSASMQVIGMLPAVAPHAGNVTLAGFDNGHINAGMLSGLMYGLLHVVGPDHLGTLMTLSTSVGPKKAFRVGAAWGLGHSSGMVSVAAVLLGARRFVSQQTLDSWEHYGNYIIGLSMVLCASYFMAFESSFLSQRADGTYVAKSCPCHGHPLPGVPEVPSTHTTSRGKACCSGFGCETRCGSGSKVLGRRGWKMAHYAHYGVPGVPLPGDAEVPEDEVETEPLMPKHGTNQGFGDTAQDRLPAAVRSTFLSWDRTDLKGALLGMVQGVCCPMALIGPQNLRESASFGVEDREHVHTRLIVSPASESLITTTAATAETP